MLVARPARLWQELLLRQFLQNGCEAMANSLLVLMPHEQTHGAFSILKQIGILSPDGTKARAVKNVMKLIANSLSVAKVAPWACTHLRCTLEQPWKEGNSLIPGSQLG